MKKSITIGTVTKKNVLTDSTVLLEITVIAPKKVNGHLFSFAIEDASSLPALSVGTVVKITYYLNSETANTEHLKSFTEVEVVTDIATDTDFIAEKYFETTGEIAFRLWMFANAVKLLKATNNQEKFGNLRAKMESFATTIAAEGTPENLQDIRNLMAKV